LSSTRGRVLIDKGSTLFGSQEDSVAGNHRAFRPSHPLAAGPGCRLREDLDLQQTPPSPHETDDHTGAGKGWRLAAFLLLSSCRGERTGIAHVVPRGRDPAVGVLDVGDAELMTVEGIGDAIQVLPDAKASP
jgi:hypothetical protein